MFFCLAYVRSFPFSSTILSVRCFSVRPTCMRLASILNCIEPVFGGAQNKSECSSFTNVSDNESHDLLHDQANQHPDETAEEGGGDGERAPRHSFACRRIVMERPVATFRRNYCNTDEHSRLATKHFFSFFLSGEMGHTVLFFVLAFGFRALGKPRNT